MASTSGYKPLKTVFHASRHGHSALEKEYARRLDSPATLQWEFDVAGYPLFLVMTVEVAAQLEKIWHTELRISDKWAALPGIGRQHYLLGILISEIRATNAIEGIFSTRKEMANSRGRGNTSYVSVDSSRVAIRSAGVSKLSVLRGLRFNCIATNSRSSAV